MRNISFVLSPLQIVCAQEAREAYCSGEENHLVIIDRTGPGTSDYDQKTAELDQSWHQVSRFTEPPRRGWQRNLRRVQNTIQIFKLHGHGKGKVFLGDPFINWFAMLARRLGTEVVWLDDGAASINVIKKFNAEGRLTSGNPNTPKFFTIFASDKTVDESNGAIAHNKLLHLRKSGRSPQQIDERWGIFIGQWLSERGGVDVDAEIAHLKKANASFPDIRMTYVSHRHDSGEKLAQIAEFMEVRQFDQTLERTLLQSPTLPRYIVSWYSSCLFTLNRLYPELQYRSVRVPDGPVTSKHTPEWENVYEAFVDLGIEVVDFR